MQAYDILILALLIGAAVWGARRGLARQLATLASLLLGYSVAVQFRQVVAPAFDIAPPWNVFAAMLALFAGTSLTIWIVFQVVSRHIEKMGLEQFDTQMGALFGLIKGGLLAMILTMFAVVMLGEKQRLLVLDSFSGMQICKLLGHAHAVVPSEWQRAMEPYLDTLEEHQVAQPGAEPADARQQTEHYEDPLFGQNAAHAHTEPKPLSANRSDDVREEPAAAQARLLEPTFSERR